MPVYQLPFARQTRDFCWILHGSENSFFSGFDGEELVIHNAVLNQLIYFAHFKD